MNNDTYKANSKFIVLSTSHTIFRTLLLVRFYTQSVLLYLHTCSLQDSTLTIMLTKNYLKVQVPEQKMSTLAFIVYNTYTISIGPFNFINTEVPSPVCNMSKKITRMDLRFVLRARDHGILLCSSIRRDSEIIYWC
ncbi:unnamed protein product [Xylocopa violacea]|uniref:Uncharacterized protein n=1 Tax=Xylocopa violacea TaxID=135666 RepID=A0ABP1N0V6_XYLVO